jgi:glucose/arabinose dehydrogenase
MLAPMRTRWASAAIALVATIPARAATPPAGFTDRVLFNASVPTGLAFEPGSGDLFVIEQGSGTGGATVLKRARAGGAVTTALSLSCVDSTGERGLLGIAFDPDYLQGASSRWVYLYYTRAAPASGACAIPGTSGSRNRVVRYKESGGTLSGEQLLLEGPVLGATNHNGGTLRFAPDKTLFVSMGDNGTGGDPSPKARDLTDLRGKILRIKRDGTGAPPDNPFVGQPPKLPEIWAWGLRNPFRFSIDVTTATPWIADVGESTWEEIDVGIPGADYGWPCFEGNASYLPCNPAPLNPVFPVLVYGHDGQGGPYNGDTIIGGPVYRGGNFPGFEGRLFFGDWADHWIRSAMIAAGNSLTDDRMFIPDAGGVTDMAQAPYGCLDFVDIGTGNIHETCISNDQDGDGYTIAQGDCDDLDPTVYPGAPEICDGKDNDCNGLVDEATCAAFGGPDAAVNGTDLSLFGRYFSQCSAAPASQPWGYLDYTKDGCLDGKDLAVLSAVWGCSGTGPICH